jgi:phospholipase/carboxylesterase
MTMRPTTPLDEDAIVWSHPRDRRAGRPLVVFMHGFYGHESDWSAWFPELPAGTVGVSLRGPTPVGERWAWVNFDQPRMTLSRTVSGLSAAARGVRAWIERQDAERIALVGWSQGGAMAVHLMRQQPARFVSAAVVAGFVADVRPHAGVRARRPPVWYGVGGRDDVISPPMQGRSRRWLAEHTAFTFADLPDEDHMLSPTLVGPALEFTAGALGRTECGLGSA